MLRSQLVLGLQPGPVQMELQRRARREPTLAFDEACKEAKAMEKETQQAHAPMDVETRRTYNSPTPPQPSHGSKSSTDPLQDWGSLKEAMRTELVEELRAQVNDMKTSLLAELRTQRTAPGPTPRQPDPASNNSSHPQGTRPRRRDRTPQWDDQGRPICLRCGQAGHMQHNCVSQGPVDHRRVASSADGSSPAEAPMKTALVGQCPEVEVLVQGSEHLNADALSRLPEALLAGRVEAPTNGGTQEVWAERQGSDPDLTLIRRWQQQGHEPSAVERQTLQLAGRQLLREWPNPTVMEGVLLCKRPASGALGEVTAVVVPVADRRQVWTRYHEALGHAKGYRLLAALRERVFWNGMNRDNRRWVRECTQCCLNSNVEGPRAPLCSIDSSYPWETLALDYLSLNRAGDRYPYILVIVDLFSRFAFAVPTKDQTAPTTARVLWTTVFQSFGCPERILTDQGPAFEAELTQQLCGLYGCHKVRTTPYHPQGNGACERMNQTILGLLNTLSQREQGRWMEHLPELTHAYNNTPHSVTGLAPFFVLFGRHARLPVDQLMGVHRSEWRGNTLEWIGEHHGRLTSAYQLVRQGTQQRQQQDQRRHNRGRRALPLLPGERVLVRDFRRRGRGKLGYHWDPRPYVVLNQPSADRPVYTLRPEGREGPTKTISTTCAPAC
ncbi:uncharacterized protein LOC125301779 [Alosa alosa]|uniref:uncharacterized protein LOC125301779 n=1 Tax=Alosa alosa TaxID=278164 RepID=UPI0020154E0E|nr:uncharacterized protein LOC125301779 [Alosa alosa]